MRSRSSQKKQLRVVELPVGEGAGTLDFKRVRGGFLVQDRSSSTPPRRAGRWRPARQPTEREWNDLRFAWAAVASVKSNAILLARNETAVGIGAGQMSRVDSGVPRGAQGAAAGPRHRGQRPGVRRLLPLRRRRGAGGRGRRQAIIQPGGSVRDAEVIEAANRHGMAMVMTGKRQFRH